MVSNPPLYLPDPLHSANKYAKSTADWLWRTDRDAKLIIFGFESRYVPLTVKIYTATRAGDFFGSALVRV